MDIGFNISKRVKHYWIYGLCGFVIAYFSFHTLCGNRNIYRLFALKHEIAQAREISSRLHNEKERLQKLGDRLSDKGLDTDLLDERARIVLNMAADDDFVILNDSL